MTILLAAAITVWHLFLLRSAWTKIRSHIPPRPIDFAIASFLVYFDTGLVLDALGVPYGAPGFSSFSDATADAKLFVYSALILVPPVLLVAAHFGRPRGLVWSAVSLRRMSRQQEQRFLVVFAAFAVIAVALSVSALRQAGSIPGARLEISQSLGPGAVLLYVPLHIAAYYPLTENSRGRRGTMISMILASVASLGVLALGQRTLVLLPFVIVAVCQFRFSFVKLAAAGGVALVMVAGLGLIFKGPNAVGPDRTSPIVTVNESFARAPVVASAFERAEPLGTSIMRYPGEGYVSAALFFVPRQIAQFKGETTAQRFTDAVQEENRGERWAFGLGMIAEAVVNVGWVPAILVLAAIGWALGALEGVSIRHPAVVVPLSGGALWLSGYHLFAILLLFGLMFATVLAIDVWMFGRSGEGNRSLQSSPGPEGGSRVESSGHRRGGLHRKSPRHVAPAWRSRSSGNYTTGPESVGDGVTGHVEPRHNPSTLISAISRLLDEPEVRREKGHAARKRAFPRNDRETLWGAYDGWLRDTIRAQEC